MISKYLAVATSSAIVYTFKSKNVAITLILTGVIDMSYYGIYYYHNQ